MAAVLLPDALWDLIEPLVPAPVCKPRGGRPRISDRACLTGIMFVLRSGIPWRMLPQEMGCGSGMTSWRRLRDWQQAEIWDLIRSRQARQQTPLNLRRRRYSARASINRGQPQ
jgi:transposase